MKLQNKFTLIQIFKDVQMGRNKEITVFGHIHVLEMHLKIAF